jgi:predicted transcriptional regulator
MNAPTNTVLGQLRRLVPHRPLHFREARRLAELQANRLRELLRLADDDLPDAAVEEVPRVSVRYRMHLPVSGFTHWENGRWIITINADEPWTRQRFSVAHELFHIINHTTKQWLHADDVLRGEQLADFFAGCLLMPKRRLQRAVEAGDSITDLADRFGVSTRAVAVRLGQLALGIPHGRCLPLPPNLAQALQSSQREVAA